MKYPFAAALIAIGISACSHHEPVTEKVVVERQREVPSRETVVEHRLRPEDDGSVTDERVVRERVVPRTEVRRTETTTTRE